MKRLLIPLMTALVASSAHAVAPGVTGTTPTGLQRGTEAELVFRGARLADAKEILFYSPGLEVVKIKETDDTSVKAIIKVSSDCRLGEHSVRIRTASGLSDLRTFFISPYPLIEENEPNNETAKAQKVPLNVTVHGRLDREDLDYYVVESKKNQRLSVEIEGIRMGRGMVDPCVSIADKNGKILAASDDTTLFLQDPYVSILAPEDGTYFIFIRDSAYAEGGYRMHVGSFPRPAAVYPAGGKAGEAAELHFIGDPAGDFTQNFKLPREAADRFGVWAERDGFVAPSANLFRVSTFPNVLESEPNNDMKEATATALELPLALNGAISKPGDVDWFRFKARKGQNFDVNVFARRIRSPLDSVVQIFDSNGRSQAQNDDSAGSDSYVRFSAPADGEYLLKVWDNLGKGGPEYTYRVEIAEPRSEVTTYIPDTARYDSQTRKMVVVPRGNRFAILINSRKNNFNGDLALSMEGLPEGVTMRADTMLARQTSIPVVFEATPEAPLAGKLLDFYARPTDKTKDLVGTFWQNVDLVFGFPNNTTYYQTYVDKLAVAVVEESPFKVSIVEPKVPLVQNGSLDLKIVADRATGYDEQINVKMLFNPPGVGSLPDVTIPKGTNVAYYRLNANGNADTRTWKIAVVASATYKGGTLHTSSQLSDLEVAGSYLAGKIDMVTTERGKTARIVCKLDQKTPFDGKATVQLLGLPNGAKASDRTITKSDSEVTFEVATDEKTQTGLHKGLFCSVTITKNGEPITQSIGNGGVLRVDAPKVKVADAGPVEKQAAARPASSPKSGK